MVIKKWNFPFQSKFPISLLFLPKISLTLLLRRELCGCSWFLLVIALFFSLLKTFTANYGPNPICKGCLTCSKDNGCFLCQHKLFFFLRREGMRQYGECLNSCPSGYYGLRAPDMNRCSSEFFLLFCFLSLQYTTENVTVISS